MAVGRIPPEELMAARITELERQVRDLQQSAMVLPFSNDRLSSVLPTNIFGYMDERVLVRRPDGSHFELRGTAKGHIPALPADPPSTDPCSIWILTTNGHLRIRTGSLVLDFTPGNAAAVTPRSVFTASTVALPDPGTITATRQTIYNSTWSGSYDGSQTLRTDTSSLHFGFNPDDTWGQQRSQIGFDYTTMAADLTGARITSVELFLAVQDMPGVGEEDTGTVRIGLHNNTSKPENYSGVYKDFTNALSFKNPESGWKQISNELATGIQLGVAKGIVIDQLTSDPYFYGYAAGANESLLPKVRITYVK